MIKKSRQNFKYLENEKSLQREVKTILLSLLKGFQLPKIFSDLRVRFAVILTYLNKLIMSFIKIKCF